MANAIIYQKSPLICDFDQPCCAICLDLFCDGDEIRVLECDHCFHKTCVDTWLLGTLSDEATYTSICPTCRRTVSSNSSVRSSESSNSIHISEISTPNLSNNDDIITNNIGNNISSPTIYETEIKRSQEYEYWDESTGISFNTFIEIGALLHSAEGVLMSPSQSFHNNNINSNLNSHSNSPISSRSASSHGRGCIHTVDDEDYTLITLD